MGYRKVTVYAVVIVPFALIVMETFFNAPPINTLKTTPKKCIIAFIITESLQEIVKRQDGSMSYGISDHQLH